MNSIQTLLLILAFSGALVLNSAALAEPPSSEAPGIEAILKAVVANNGQIQEAEGDVEIARQQVERAKAAMWPRGTTTILAAPLFEEKGDALNVTRDFSKWGPYLSSQTQIIQPLYTFGQIGGFRKAADNQLIVNQELAKVKRNEAVATAKDFYYSFLMASDLEKLVNNLVEFLSEAVEQAEQSTEQGKKAEVRPHDLARLKVALDDLLQKKLYAQQGRQTAQKAVLWMTGGAFASLATTGLEPQNYQPKSLDEYLKLARAFRPEFKALAAGQVARNALADAKDAQSYPTLFIGAMADLNWSPVRNRQRSFYAQDPFNRVQGALALGLRLDLEFARHSAEAAEERAQVMKLRATEKYAVPGIELEVSRAYWELEQAREGLEIAQRRKKVGRKWFVGNAMGWSIGVTAPKDLLESLEGDGTSRMNYIQTVYQFNAAQAKLSKAVGTEISELNY